jgi:hypothetical protein
MTLLFVINYYEYDYFFLFLTTSRRSATVFSDSFITCQKLVLF